jgi:hypothetical protein
MKIIIISLLMIFTFGCENLDPKQTAISQLNEKIKHLETENKILRDSLDDYEENFLYSQMLIGIPDDYVLTVGKKNNIAMLFQTYNVEIPEYEIFKIEDEKRIKLGTNNKTSFDYEFIPKSIDDNKINLVVKIPFKNKTIEIPAGMIVDLKE